MNQDGNSILPGVDLKPGRMTSGGATAAFLRRFLVIGLCALWFVVGGCAEDDCVNCVELPLPVVPTGVHSISGDGEIVVQWYAITHAPYDDTYSPSVAKYFIYSRFFEFGDEDDSNREFFLIGEVDWNENYDGATGLHWFVDNEVDFDQQYEYAVTAVNADGRESALSFEFVVDVPVHIGDVPVGLYNHNGTNPQWSGFDFSRLAFGRLDPDQVGTTADIRIAYRDGVPYVETVRATVLVQDFGVFLSDDGSGNDFLVFEGVSWAPEDGYSSTGVLELVLGHIYVVEIYDPIDGLHYAKFGVVGINTDSVEIVWAYQTMEGMPELKVADPAPGQTRDFSQIVSF